MVFDTKKHSIKAKAEYRRIDKYFKSLQKTRLEEKRRKKVLECWLAGYSTRRIAYEVGVSNRTVNRDLAKLSSTIKRRYARLLGSVAENERIQITKYLEGLNPVEQIKWIGKYLDAQAFKSRRRSCRKLLIVINADAVDNGVGVLGFKPKSPALVAPYVINFRLVLRGESRFVGQLQVA
jgi:hypothetical protein